MNTLTVLKKGFCMREERGYILTDYGKPVHWDKGVCQNFPCS